MLDSGYIAGVVVLLFAIVFTARALPFFFSKYIVDNQLLNYLGKNLPICVFVLLTLYFMMSMIRPEHGRNLPWQLISIGIVIVVHLRWRNVTISVLSGSLVYLCLDLWLNQAN